MTERLTLSRRKTLAALGSIGIASAGAGLGTSAYFSDQETFENNQLVAGTLDMKVGWEEHYSDWSDDETDGLPTPEDGLDAVLMEQPAQHKGRYTGFPIGESAGDKTVWVHDDAVQTFMDNTAVEAYPDADDDGVQDSYDAADVCTDDSPLADVPDDMDPTAADSARTEKAYGADGVGRAEATYDSDGPLPLISLEDLKPGDFGEVTFTFQLCDNPGYVWLNGDLVSASEGVVTEPEADDPDEADGDGEAPADVVELLDEIQVALWHDEDCDNLRDRAFRPPWKSENPENPEPANHGGVDGDGGVDANERWIDPETGERLPDEQGARGDATVTLREFLEYLETPAPGSDVAGIPLSGDVAAEDGGGSGRNCFAGDSQHCVGLSWWLPVDHANEIQDDSVGFDLGFYTEQCRHNDGSGQPGEAVVVQSDATGGVRETDNWITATIRPGPTTQIEVELDGAVYGDESGEWPNNPTSYVMEAVVDHDFDGLAGADSNGHTDDFRIGYGGADSATRTAAGYSSPGGYIKRRQPDGSFVTVGEEDLTGFSASESGDQLSYTFEIDWTSDLSPTGSDVGIPDEMIVNEVFGSDGGEGVAADVSPQNEDGREDVDNTTSSSGTIQL